VNWLLRLLGLASRRDQATAPNPMREVDADLVRQEPAYEAPPEPETDHVEDKLAMVEPDTPQRKAKPGTLAAIIGFAAAAIALTIVPKDESGRTVDVTIADDGTAKVRHVSGRQYLQAYLDVAGIATACDGIIRVDGRPVRLGDVFTPDQCAGHLERELIAHAQGMMRCTPAFRSHPDKEAIGPTLAAVTSFTYNIGVGGYCGSTAARRFNAGDWRGGCEAMMMWNKARVNGRLQPVRGLTLRRERERVLCLRGLA
jgi:lysozyme